jgi:hypothetical protein
LVSLIPALVLLASVDCLSDSFASCGCIGLSCLLSADGHCKHNQCATDNSFDKAAQRWSRRLNVQAGSDGFSPVALALWQSVLPDQKVQPIDSPVADLELGQSWQFLWRTASEPRAPSPVS